MVKELTISLLGHKDHGKSTLIGKMLIETGSISEDRINEARAICKGMGKEFEPGFLLDSFVEEREGGFTLDTTRVQIRSGEYIFNLIDVPGHKELVKNMLSGASNADCAILIVSAMEGEGLQKETLLHIKLARMLGLERMIVTINKMDFSGYDRSVFGKVEGEVKKALSEFGFDPGRMQFVPISALKGDNIAKKSINWYEGESVLELMKGLYFDRGRMLRSLPARMVVQDYAEQGGEGIIIGKVEAGVFRKGETIVSMPGRKKGAIRKIMGARGETESVEAGQGAGFSCGFSASRGEVCMGPDSAPAPVRKLKAEIFCFPSSSVREGAHLKLICSSQESGATLKSIASVFDPVSGKGGAPGIVGPGQFAHVEIETEKEMVLEQHSKMPVLGRFVLSDGKGIIGIGVVE
ncbi:MAG TPA: GTP-binding protein [Candidatus Bilamarchaeum sp.]|nr:GTP-binding protein [Candidatus Bilamarchaeum sp.]